MKKSDIVNELIDLLPEIQNYHAPTTKLHGFLKSVARKEFESIFLEKSDIVFTFSHFGDIWFPYFNMGAVDSIDLFDLDELIIFSYYLNNKSKYKNVLDLGANIGLHSVILSKCGFNVRSFEPDPVHFEVLTNNLASNNCLNVEPINAAISYKDGLMEFVRVVGNTTGSHLAGSKNNPYGELERFSVDVRNIVPMLEWADLVKMDVEGHEKEIFKNTNVDNWRKVDVILEVQDENSATIIFDFFNKSGVNLFSEKTNWAKVKSLIDMPKSYHDGSLFITSNENMAWI